jgi:hypothetical protein
VERSKLGRLFQRRFPKTLVKEDPPELQLPQLTSAPQDLEKDEMYQPPGELAALANSVSKLIVPAVKVDPWSIFWLVAVALTAGTGVLSFLLLTGVPPVPDCKHISILATDSERLYCAKLGAETNKKARVIEAISLVKGWSEIDPLYNDGKNLLGDWSRQLLRLAKQEMASGGNLKQSIADVRQIPPHSSAYKEAQDLIQQWEEQWSDGKDITVEFPTALQAFDWNAGYGYLAKVRSFKSAYWHRTKYHEMSLEFARQKDAWDKFQEADRLAKKGEKLPESYTNEPDNLAKAISVAAVVAPNTYIKPHAQAQRVFWSRKLLALAAAKYAAKDYAEANEIAQKVPQDVSVYAEAEYWQQLSQAPTDRNPAPKNVLAQAHQTAQAGTIPAINSAIEIAGKIAGGDPLYADAQQSITNWNNILQYGADYPIVENARNLAKQGDLEGAIALAKTIPATRGLYRTAQGDIAVWTVQLPLAKNIKTFKAAEVLFLKGQAAEAIELGKTIPEDSNLYKPMQQYIKYWASTIKPKPSSPPVANP